MKVSQKLFAAVTVFFVAANVFAQDFGFDDGAFGDSSSDSASSSPAVTIGGKVELSGRAYVDQRDKDGDRYGLGSWRTEAAPSGKLSFDYNGTFSDVSLKLKFDRNSLGDYKWDILDEFTARAYIGNALMEAGKMKVVWGKGDKLHVVDNFNANDYTDYIIPDYVDRRISEPMFRFVYSTDSNVKFEGIYTPVMTPDRLASGGVWQPKAARTLTELVTEIQTKRLTAALAANDGPKVAAISGFSSDDLYPDTWQLKYGQFGARSTFTVGSVDLGLSYYYGHNKQPSVNLENYLTELKKVAVAGAAGMPYNPELDIMIPSLVYDRVQIIGLEGAAILFGRLNSRFEAAYNLTDDIAGDDPWVHNNSISWVGGFDIDLPVSNININIQEQGKYILNNDKIEDGTFRNFDVDYDSVHTYSNNKIVLAVTDSYNHENIKLDLKGIWGIERGDILVIPSVSFKVKDDFFIDLSGLFIWCNSSDSEFDGWEHNSFAQISCKYQF